MHTPLWKLRTHPETGELTEIYLPGKADPIASTAFHGWSREEREDHAARLVACVNGCQGIADPAAVRDLLEALQTLVRRIERDNLNTTAGVRLEPARAAIARATASESKSAQGV